ncbi:recombinase family protein [Allocoleopsis sp.]|uniref:recombinase family protein n=1 Tax=Allocoleopsis sp. TaxID=3088169 RepID=UPI002FD54C0E
MKSDSIWISGSTRSGKTTRLVRQFRQWVEQGRSETNQIFPLASPMTHRDNRASEARPSLANRRQHRTMAPALLVFAANDDNRRDLTEQLTMAIQGKYPIRSKTPLGFFQDEVMLFWPLLIQPLNLRGQFPVRLRPETEQELATGLWRNEIEQWSQSLPGSNEYTKVRRLLDLLLLAAVSGTPLEDVSTILQQGILELEETPEVWDSVGQMLLGWRQWCLERGFLTYGIICELYWRHLLPNPTYQQYLQQRYQAVLADDVDDYPAIARDLFDVLLDQGAIGAFTYNPDGKVRLGLNADPDYLEGLAARCQVETLTETPVASLAEFAEDVVHLVSEPIPIASVPESMQSIQTTSRAALLRQTAKVIIDSVKSGQVQPGEIVVIAPGLDEIARYVLTDILTKQGISVEPLNDQRPLTSSPMIRALLTLLALVYPGLGRLVDRDAIAEMLVVLSQKPADWVQAGDKENPPANLSASSSRFPIPQIDPVRAGLLADYCYSPDPEHPRLLPVESFMRWDRLGHRATAAYSEIVEWLEVQRSQQQQRLIQSCVVVLDRAIQKFLWNGSNLPYDAIAALRELMETAQHYWEVDGRLRQELKVRRLNVESFNLQPSTPNNLQPSTPSNLQPSNLQPSTSNNLKPSTPSNLLTSTQTIAQFIQMLRRGTVTANPYPVRRLPTAASNAVTLATIFQYRASRRSHRWHFWLDAGSPLWLSGGAATLFAAHLFLKDWSGQPWTEEDKVNADNERLERIVRNLLARAGERVYLCHSDLAVNGTDQAGPLLTLVHTAVPLGAEV